MEQHKQEQLTWHRAQSPWYETLGRLQVRAVREAARRGALLDLACGDGSLTAQMGVHFDPVVGVDASAAHTYKARARLPDAVFHTALIEDFDTTDRFDTITMLNLLEHVVDPVAILDRARGWLAPGGCVIAHVPNALAVNRKMGRVMGMLADEYQLSDWDTDVAGHRRYYDLAQLCADFESAGLRIVETGGIFYKIFSTAQMKWLKVNGWWGEYDGWPTWDVFCDACYELGKERPEDCNVIWAMGAL